VLADYKIIQVFVKYEYSKLQLTFSLLSQNVIMFVYDYWYFFCLDVGKIVGTTVVQIRNEVLEFVRVLVDQVKSIPIVSNFREQYKQVSKHCILVVGK
jgi:hypothetical protein